MNGDIFSSSSSNINSTIGVQTTEVNSDLSQSESLNSEAINSEGNDGLRRRFTSLSKNDTGTTTATVDLNSTTTATVDSNTSSVSSTVSNNSTAIATTRTRTHESIQVDDEHVFMELIAEVGHTQLYSPLASHSNSKRPSRANSISDFGDNFC